MGNVYAYIPYMDAMGMETAGVFVFLLNQLIASTFWKEPSGRSLSFFFERKTCKGWHFVENSFYIAILAYFRWKLRVLYQKKDG